MDAPFSLMRVFKSFVAHIPTATSVVTPFITKLRAAMILKIKTVGTELGMLGMGGDGGTNLQKTCHVRIVFAVSKILFYRRESDRDRGV